MYKYAWCAKKALASRQTLEVMCSNISVRELISHVSQQCI